jgi:myosin heavy subunit
VPFVTEEQYMITQVRYLGVFETIQIRKKTFPSRWLYEEFLQRFEALFPISSGNPRAKTEKIIQQLATNNKEYLFGNKRVYMNPEL